MQVQFNTDKIVNGDERHQAFFTSQINDSLERFQDQITRIEVHLSDENGSKDGINDIRCMLEARLKNRQPIAVIFQADNSEKAISGALDKVKSLLEKMQERLSNH
jgi:ribosome-associated translation inhibitor RaiA